MTDDVIGCEEQKSAHETQSSAVTFCSSHAMASSVIYYSTDAQKNEIYLFYIIIKLAKSCHDPRNKLAKLDHAIS